MIIFLMLAMMTYIILLYIVAYVFSLCLPKEFHFLAIFSRRLKRQALDLDYVKDYFFLF